MNDSNNINLSSIIYGSYTKKDRLQKIVFETFSNTSIAEATHLNIFIDLYSVLHPVFSEHFRVNVENYTDITSCIINMCGHYRSFFKGLGVSTTFYLVYSDNTCEFNRKFVAEYNASFLKKSMIKMFRDIVDNNLELLSTICPYLPNIHFIRSIYNWETAVIIGNIIETINDGNPNLIISRDIYPLQLCCMYPYTSYLYPLKFRGEDKSMMVPLNEKPEFRTEFWNLFLKDKIRSFKQMDEIKINANLYDISPINISLLEALNGLKCREINAMHGISAAKKAIYELTNGEDIKIDVSQLLINRFKSTSINLNLPIVESRVKALDIMFALPYYKQDPESKYKFVNLQDSTAINMINSKYFERNPLDLQKL